MGNPIIKLTGNGTAYDCDTQLFDLVPLHLIDTNPYQVRLIYNEESIISLAEDIHQQRSLLPQTLGLSQVPMGRLLSNNRVQLAFGHRRYLAFVHLYKRYGDDWGKIPIQIRDLSKADMARLAWSENESREDITAIEKAFALKKAMTELNLTLSEVAGAWGIHISTASNLNRLLQLPQEIQQMILKKELLEKHGRLLLPLIQIAQNEREAVRLATAAVENSYSTRKVMEEVTIAMERLTTTIEAGMVEHEITESMLPPGCAATCNTCAHFREWGNRTWCSRPELYEQKRQIWLTKGNTEDNRKTEVSNDASHPNDEVLGEFIRDTEAEQPIHHQLEISLFGCPRCNHDKINSVDGSSRYCTACGAEWFTFSDFFKEVNAKLTQTLARTFANQGVRFETGMTWNNKPTSKCLNCQVKPEELHRVLSQPDSEFIPNPDGVISQFCPYLRLFLNHTEQFIPEAGGDLSFPLCGGSTRDLYPVETKAMDGREVCGKKVLLFDSFDAFCMAPDVQEADGCFNQQENVAHQSIVDELRKQGLPAVLPDFIKLKQRAGDFIWLDPQLGDELCTPTNCRYRDSEPPGFVSLAQPGGFWRMVCTHAECGSKAKEALIDLEAEQRRHERESRRAALNRLQQISVERTLFAPSGEQIDVSKPAFLAVVEPLLVPTWDTAMMAHIVAGWQGFTRQQIAAELNIPNSLAPEVTRTFRNRYGDLATEPRPDEISGRFALLREQVTQSEEGLRRWFACVAVVRVWRDQVETVEGITEAIQRVYGYL